MKQLPLKEHKVYRPAEGEMDEVKRVREKYDDWIHETGRPGLNMIGTSTQEGVGPIIWIGFVTEADAEALVNVIPDDIEGVPVFYSVVGEIRAQAQVEA